MSYYQRPMGDYKTYGYAGDPGFLSGLWKGFKKVARFIPGPIGTVARVAGLAGIGVGAAKMLEKPLMFPNMPMPPPSFPGVGAQVQQRLAMSPQQTMALAGQCPSGYHPAKDGSGRMVRNRRMNVANPRALRRAMRRVQGFEKLAKRTISFTRRTRMKK